MDLVFSPELLAQASKIKLLLMDVDGVMTDGTLWNVPGPDGEIFETKGFDSQDGIGLQWLSWYGIKTGVISGRISPATEVRAKQCKMAYIYQGHIEKIPILEEILADAKVAPDQVATSATTSPMSSLCAASESASPSPTPAKR